MRSDTNRRQFLQRAGLAAGIGLAPAAAAGKEVAIIADTRDPVASSPPVQWAAGELEQTLASLGIRVHRHPAVDQAPAAALCVLVAGAQADAARGILSTAKVSVPSADEALGLAPGRLAGRTVTLACGSDPRGAVYALLELADRARHAAEPAAGLLLPGATVERPANVVRSIARCFESDIEDKSWFNDRAFWGPYLTMLASHRYNRFSLTLGLGYNFPRNVRDVYFYFAYPFLVSVPGYEVRAKPLPDAERDANLEMLRFIGEETVKRGLQFQLALWTHAYHWIDSPNANYVIEGLTPGNHAAYCRDALTAVLKACPAISGLTFRVHGESGIPEGNYDFWKTVFDGVVRCGRRVDIDMHAKGMDQRTIDVALATGMPVKISPKYWAEHMGLSYHQASIRELEMPPRDRQDEGVFALSGGSRRFLRYGYGDLMTESRGFGILHRIWPGTQRLLLWGDPALAAGYGRSSSFCGSDGVELCEPLSFKGRMGSGLPGGRNAYADASLSTRYDWEKFSYTYRVWGRLIYNPAADPESWRRYLRKDFQGGATAAEAALANASRILLLVTTAHGASGSNNRYWPEMYTDMPVVDAAKSPYTDTPEPRRFGAASSFDPQLFSTVDNFAKELLDGQRSGKYSPSDVAQWLENFAGAAAGHLKEAEKRVGTRSPEFRRLAADVSIQSGIGWFFAWKMRAAVLWALHESSGDVAALQEALKAYRAARAAWNEMANGAKSIYAADVTYGTSAFLRGHWLDRLPAIDRDIAGMEKRLAEAKSASASNRSSERVAQAIREALASSRQAAATCRHAAPPRFKPGEPLAVELSLDKGSAQMVRLHFRRVNQAEAWQSADMPGRENRYRAVIPGGYTQSPYPLQYYFELREGAHAWLHPGFETTLSNQPYFVVRTS